MAMKNAHFLHAKNEDRRNHEFLGHMFRQIRIAMDTLW